MEHRLVEAQDELSGVLDHVAHLEHANKSISIEASNFKAAAEKAECLLSSRTERFVESRARQDAKIKTVKSTAEEKYNKLMQSKEEEIRRLKAAAETRVMFLEKRHGMVIRKAQSIMYNEARSHTKQIVQYEKKIDALHKSKE
jgi:esterase/lipase